MNEGIDAKHLQCCGNCMEYFTCDKYDETYQWCDMWQWDSMTQSKREKERTGDED